MSAVSPASVLTGSWLLMLGQHGPLVKVLSGELGSMLGSHLCNLASHVMELQTKGEINAKAVARARKKHTALAVFAKYADEAEYVLDAFGLVAFTAGADTATGDAINALGVRHGMTVRASNTLSVRAHRACKTLAHLKAEGNITGTDGVGVVSGVLATPGMRKALDIRDVELSVFTDRCASFIAKVKDTSRGHEVKSALDVVVASLRA